MITRPLSNAQSVNCATAGQQVDVIERALHAPRTSRSAGKRYASQIEQRQAGLPIAQPGIGARAPSRSRYTATRTRISVAAPAPWPCPARRWPSPRRRTAKRTSQQQHSSASSAGLDPQEPRPGTRAATSNGEARAARAQPASRARYQQRQRHSDRDGRAIGQQLLSLVSSAMKRCKRAGP